MKLQLPQERALKRFRTTIPAEYYNSVRLAQIRDANPIEVILGGRGLHVFLDKEAWLVTDRNLGEIPVLAWTGLQPGARDGVHRAVPCELVYYHAYASVIVRTVLPDIALRLSRLAARPESSAKIVSIPFSPAR